MITTVQLTGTRAEAPASRIAFLQAGWHAELTDCARDGFRAELANTALGPVTLDFLEVPGPLEIPLQAKVLARSGHYQAIVGAASAGDIGAYRHDSVADAILHGLMQVQLETGVPILSLVLTPQQSTEHAMHHEFSPRLLTRKGGEVARACAATMLHAAEVSALLDSFR